MDFSHSSSFISTQNHNLHNTMVDNCSPLFTPSFPSPISVPDDSIYPTLLPLNPDLLHDEFSYPPDIYWEDLSDSFMLPTLPYIPPPQSNGLTFDQYNPLFNLDPSMEVQFNSEVPLFNLDPSMEVQFSSEVPIDTTFVTINESSQNAIGEGRMEASKSPEERRHGKWDKEEDRRLIKLVGCPRKDKWSEISKKMGNRSGKQCRDRWDNQIRPNIKKDKFWSEKEEAEFVRMHKIVGNKWFEIAKQLPGRTESSVKNRWFTEKRKLQHAKELPTHLSHLSSYILSLLPRVIPDL